MNTCLYESINQKKWKTYLRLYPLKLAQTIYNNPKNTLVYILIVLILKALYESYKVLSEVKNDNSLDENKLTSIFSDGGLFGKTSLNKPSDFEKVSFK